MSEPPATFKVAYLGPKATYSYQAAHEEFAHYPGASLDPQPSIPAVFVAVAASPPAGPAAQTRFGVVPFENSTNGAVEFTLDSLLDRHAQFRELTICGEHLVAVRHCLLVPPTGGGSAAESDLARIRRVHSHPQALAQCAAYLKQHLPQARLVDEASTTAAAAIVARDASGESAAIASRAAGERSGLHVLQADIQDRADNATRFYILCRTSATRSDPPLASATPESLGWKTLVAFRVEHGRPGALADALAVFKECQVGLTSLNSRPSGAGPWQYVFFIECDGRRGEEEGTAVSAALQRLKRATIECRWWGSWRLR